MHNIKCVICGTDFDTKDKRRSVCSVACRRRRASEVMAATNRKHASKRMRENNPMKDKESREKMAATLRTKGHRPIFRGGNGVGATEPQRMLAEALGWVIEYSIPTKLPRKSGFPTCYKLDIANPSLLLGIEVDGRSHTLLERQEQDRKKVKLLESFGWLILRFTNEQVREDLAGCVSKVKQAIGVS